MQVCPPSRIHTIITDDSVDPVLVEKFNLQGLRVVTV
jgi:DeoR/GlpR family transcriptional regulator of sugar metabolism